MADLRDSGQRRDFSTGAQRDMQEGKGRCDLLPMREVADLLNKAAANAALPTLNPIDCIASFLETEDINQLFKAVLAFIGQGAYPDVQTAMLELSIHMEDGARKYAERNWEKGIPMHSFIDSGVRHYLKYKRGDKDEPHDRAFMWNMLCGIHIYRNHSELYDIKIPKPSKESINNMTVVKRP